jgi:hypothetical protein
MTILSVKDVRAVGDALSRDSLQHANHAVTLLDCIKPDLQEVCTPVVAAAHADNALPAASSSGGSSTAAVCLTASLLRHQTCSKAATHSKLIF